MKMNFFISIFLGLFVLVVSCSKDDNRPLIQKFDIIGTRWEVNKLIVTQDEINSIMNKEDLNSAGLNIILEFRSDSILQITEKSSAGGWKEPYNLGNWSQDQNGAISLSGTTGTTFAFDLNQGGNGFKVTNSSLILSGVSEEGVIFQYTFLKIE